MHIPLLRTLVLAFLLAVLAACSDVSSVDAPAVEEVNATPISASEVDTTIPGEVIEDRLADGELEAAQNTNRYTIGVSDTPVKPIRGVCFYSNANYGGSSYCLDSPILSIPVGLTGQVPGVRSSWNDRASSVIVAPGYKVEMFYDANYGGGGFSVDAGNSEQGLRLAQLGFDNELTSFRVRRVR